MPSDFNVQRNQMMTARSDLHRAVLVKNREKAMLASKEGRRARNRNDLASERKFRRLEALAAGRPGIREAAEGKARIMKAT